MRLLTTYLDIKDRAANLACMVIVLVTQKPYNGTVITYLM
jgi:hypothetical protein